MQNTIKNGQNAKSVYDLWLEVGNKGDVEDFLDSLKGASITTLKGVTIAASSWVSSNGIYKTTITDANIKSHYVVNVNFTTDSITTAINSGVLGYTNSIDGGFELYANFKPSADLVIDYAIIGE